jgi:hypothetical protein
MCIIERWKNADELQHEARVRLYLSDAKGFAHYAVAWYLTARIERERAKSV